MIEIAIALIGVVAGNLSALLFLPQMKKSKKLENEAKQSEEWKKLYDETHAQLLRSHTDYDNMVAEKDAKIDSLYEEISRQRDAKAEKSKRITELEVDNTRLCMLKCEVVGCPNRKPPTGY